MTVLDQAPPAEAVRSAVPEPASEPTDPDAVVAVVMDFVGATLAQLDQLLEEHAAQSVRPGNDRQPLSVVETHAGWRPCHRGLAIASITSSSSFARRSSRGFPKPACGNPK